MNESVIRNHKKNIIILLVLLIIIIILNYFTRGMLSIQFIISYATCFILLAIMWLLAIKGSKLSGYLGFIFAFLFILSFDIVSIGIGMLVIYDSVDYIQKVNKV